MKIRIDPHTLVQASERGTNQKEIIEVLEEGIPVQAKYGRMGKAKVFTYKRIKKGKYYEQKRVEVIYAMEKDVAVTVTVYVYYGKWRNAE